jgi:hypothetical protein
MFAAEVRGMGLVNGQNWKYRVKEVLVHCGRLQRLEQRSEDWGVSELMRMAVLAERDDDTVIALCRLLFRSREGGPLRRPMLGEPGFLGGGEPDGRWPLEPVHLFQGVPFYVVRLYGLAGLPESGPLYLSYCLRNGVWNGEAYPEFGDGELRAIAEEFIESGPWAEPLGNDERQLLLSQVE